VADTSYYESYFIDRLSNNYQPQNVIVNDPDCLYDKWIYWSSADAVSFYCKQVAEKIRHGAVPKAIAIVLTTGPETVSERSLSIFNAVVEAMHSIYKVPVTNCYHAADYIDCESNRSQVNKYNIWGANMINTSFLKTIQENFVNEPRIDFTPKQKPFKMLFYNKSPRPQRYALAYSLAHKKLLDSCIWSAHWPIERESEAHHLSAQIFPDFVSQHLGDEIESQFPKILSYDISEYMEPSTNEIDSTYFSLITETCFTTHNYGVEPNRYNIGMPGNIFITEKTWRTINCYHPFVLASTPYSLKALKENGYKTFERWWDESYDQIEDDNQRLQQVLETASNLINLSDSDWVDMLTEMLPVLKHNRALLIQDIAPDYYTHNQDQLVDIMHD